MQAMHPIARVGYLYLLASAWQTDDCCIPDDEIDLASLSGLGDELWSQYKPRIMRKFVRTESGRLRNEVLFVEWSETRRIWQEKQMTPEQKAELSSKRSAAGIAGNEKRWGNHRKTSQVATVESQNVASCDKSHGKEIANHRFTGTDTSTSTKKVQKPSRDKREPDPRHVPFREACEAYAEHMLVTFVWDASDATVLSRLLAAAPTITLEIFRCCLNNRARSPAVIHSDRPRVWLANILSFEHSAKNQFNQPEGTSNGTFKGKTESSIDAGRQALATIGARAQAERDRIAVEQAWNPQAGAVIDGRLPGLRTGS